MSWLRLDDKFVRHPKITRLARNDRWTWLEVLSYCSEYKTAGFVPDTIREVVPKATAPFLERCYQLHLLDLTTGNEHATYRVHHWDDYNPKDPTKADRMARWRDRKRDGAVDTCVDSEVDAGGDGAVDENVRLQKRLRDGAPSRPLPKPVPLRVQT